MHSGRLEQHSALYLVQILLPTAGNDSIRGGLLPTEAESMPTRPASSRLPARCGPNVAERRAARAEVTILGRVAGVFTGPRTPGRRPK